MTAALSDLADLAVDKALQAFTADEIRRGKRCGPRRRMPQLPRVHVCPVDGQGRRARVELFLDIDLICLFDQDRYGGIAPAPPS